MIIKRLKEYKRFISGDGAILRELFHAAKGKFKFRYSLAHAVVRPGIDTKLHSLKTSEVYYILKGKGIMYVDKESRTVAPGCAVYIPPRAKQHIKNTGNAVLEFICIVDPAWRKKDEEVF